MLSAITKLLSGRRGEPSLHNGAGGQSVSLFQKLQTFPDARAKACKDMTHLYSKCVDSTVPFLRKLPARSNPFLFFLGVILDDQTPFFRGREPVETLVQTG